MSFFEVFKLRVKFPNETLLINETSSIICRSVIFWNESLPMIQTWSFREAKWIIINLNASQHSSYLISYPNESLIIESVKSLYLKTFLDLLKYTFVLGRLLVRQNPQNHIFTFMNLVISNTALFPFYQKWIVSTIVTSNNICRLIFEFSTKWINCWINCYINLTASLSYV